MSQQTKERYFTGDAKLDFILQRLSDRLDILEGLRPDLDAGYLELESDKDITTGSLDPVTMTFANAGLRILDTDASHDLIISPGSNLSADRTLTITTGDSSRTITLSGNPTLADWFDQAVKTTSAVIFDYIQVKDDNDVVIHQIGDSA